jgi:hypothetical protein
MVVVLPALLPEEAVTATGLDGEVGTRSPHPSCHSGGQVLISMTGVIVLIDASPETMALLSAFTLRSK